MLLRAMHVWLGRMWHHSSKLSYKGIKIVDVVEVWNEEQANMLVTFKIEKGWNFGFGLSPFFVSSLLKELTSACSIQRDIMCTNILFMNGSGLRLYKSYIWNLHLR